MGNTELDRIGIYYNEQSTSFLDMYIDLLFTATMCSFHVKV